MDKLIERIIELGHDQPHGPFKVSTAEVLGEVEEYLYDPTNPVGVNLPSWFVDRIGHMIEDIAYMGTISNKEFTQFENELKMHIDRAINRIAYRKRSDVA